VNDLPGTPSDDDPAILATGRSDVSHLFVSMSARHPEGRDREYLVWHTLDHRPEQQRLREIRTSIRIVSTPACRATRAAGDPRYDAVDHVQTYFFFDPTQPGFVGLSDALRAAGRMSIELPPVERGMFTVADRRADGSAKVGADVLPWWPARGVYLLLEEGTGGTTPLLDVDGVAGVWTAEADGRQLSYCFLSDDPAAVGERLRPVAEARNALLGAPFHTIVPWEWDRYLP
jgi:hypothetical protein